MRKILLSGSNVASQTGNNRLFIVPGMAHMGGHYNGPSRDEFDMVDALVACVEEGKAPDSVVAKARGKGRQSELRSSQKPEARSDKTSLCLPHGP